MLVTLEETKQYLRIDGDYDDELIKGLMSTANDLCLAILRQDESELDGENPRLRTAIFYAVTYLYEHRDEADHRGLALTLRDLLSGLRKEGF
ncbi:head-tail connector protein [Anaerovibrio sp.]|uniref:head-tail connector protein n=1 Tax=Anaerovibrio sp. TaxID=1872532 RepID=UPI0025C25189|nr:head-tail connector protein [Anaerovibrio sp.]MBR2143495.1 head-tail connector protein [Anaerovibrio sp.]